MKFTVENVENLSLVNKTEDRENNQEKGNIPKDLELFLDFIRENEAEIDEKILAGGNLRDILYDEFYSGNFGNPDFPIKDPDELMEIIYQFGKEVQRVEADISAKIDQYWELKDAEDVGDDEDNEYGENETPPIIIRNNKHWLQLAINGGVNVLDDSIGRLYFNCNIQSTPQFFEDFASTCAERGIRMEMKMPRTLDEHALTRPDRMVVYFDAEEESAILQVADELHAKNSSIFNSDSIPRFTTSVNNSSGNVMRGVGFGEEPMGSKGKVSFGIVRVAILEAILDEAVEQGLLINDPKFNIQAAFKKACEKFGVDYRNPAFNKYQKNGKGFSEIKKRSESK